MDKLMSIKMFARVSLSAALCVALTPLAAFSGTEMSAAERPSDRLSLKGKDGRLWWRELYEEQLDCIRKSNGRFDFVLIGDSITSNWRRKDGKSYFGGTRRIGKNVADEFFSGYKWLNAGIGGDGTPQVLWRCLNGILDGYEAKIISLMVGTNNRRESAEDVALGIKRIVETIRKKQPKAKILLSPILPRFAREDDPGDMNAKNEKTNKIIQGYCDGSKIIWFDWREGLYKNGILDKTFWYDREHPAEGGYRLWAKALLPYISSSPASVSLAAPLDSTEEK